MTDKTKPKRKPNAYMNFVKKMRPKVVKDFPDLTFTEIGSKLGEMWRALTDDEKKKYA
jgi:structure-specific recognition protein 1